VVLPGAAEALHIFEPRYRAMVAAELARALPDRLIAMALLRPGFEDCYYTHYAPIHPVVCVSRIMRHEDLRDGRHNILIRGLCRATIIEEQHDEPYRRGLLEVQDTIRDLLPEEEANLRRALAECVSRLPPEPLKLSCEITAQEQCLERVVDLMAGRLLNAEASPAKQMILAEPRLDFRVKMLVTLLERLYLSRSRHCVTAGWPPQESEN
jgi:Lon protease-like protein